MAEKKTDTELIKTVAVIGGVVFLVSKVSSAFGSIKNPFGDNVPPQLQQYIKDKYTSHVDLINALNINQSKLNFHRNTYRRIAQQQYEAMNGIGTNEAVLFDTLKGLKADDLKTVFMDFGLRAPTIFSGSFATGGRMDLIQWYQSELNKSELNKMADIWRVTGLMK
jgi:hypothetical protein